MQNEPTSSTFEPYIQENFRIFPPEGEEIETQLIEVKLLGTSTETTERAPFSILFRGPATPVLPQNIYRIEHAGLGTLELFLVPIGPDEKGDMRYEAVFT